MLVGGTNLEYSVFEYDVWAIFEAVDGMNFEDT